MNPGLDIYCPYIRYRLVTCEVSAEWDFEGINRKRNCLGNRVEEIFDYNRDERADLQGFHKHCHLFDWIFLREN